jgi:glycosyltransferase involved in cell wall biosynthesis
MNCDFIYMKLGIVTISYIQAAFLQECIDSVALQAGARENLLYAIVDPGSTDGSREIIHRNVDRFSAVLLDPDNGPADGLNKGFAKLREAEVFGFINSDDFYLPGALDVVSDFFARHPDADVLFGETLVVDECGRSRGRRLRTHRFTLQNYLDKCGTFAQQGMFFRRQLFELVGGFNVENRSCWDVELFVDFLLARPNCSVHLIQHCLGAFRLYPGSISGSQRDVQKYRVQRDRLCSKIAASGRKPSGRLAVAIKRTAFRVSLRWYRWRCALVS